MKNHIFYRIVLRSGHSVFNSNSFFIVDYNFVMSGIYIMRLKAIVIKII